MKKIWSLALLLLFLVGCEEKEAQPVDNTGDEREEEIVLIKQQLRDLENQLAELKESHDVQYENQNFTITQLLQTEEQMKHLLNHLPDIERKWGYIENINHVDSDVTIQVQIVDMVTDESAPNNFRLDYLEGETLKVSEDLLIYALNGVDFFLVNSLDELNERINDYERLFIFTLIDDTAVLLQEQYLP